LSTNRNDFIDNLIISVTNRKQENDNAIMPALVPDMIPETFVSSSGNLVLGKQSTLPYHSLEEFGEYENDALDISNHPEFSSTKQDRAPTEIDRKNEIKATYSIATPRNDVDIVEKDAPSNTISSSSPTPSSSPSASPGESKKHRESAEDNSLQEIQNNFSLSISSEEDLEINEINNREIMDNDISSTYHNGNPTSSENRRDVAKAPHIYANYGNLKNIKKNDASKQNEVDVDIHPHSNLSGIADKLDSKLIKADSQVKFDRARKGDYNEKQQNYEGTINVKEGFHSFEKDLKEVEKVAGKDKNYYYPHNLPRQVTSNNKGSSPTSYSSPNHEEPIINIHIGRIEVRTRSRLDPGEASNYYDNDSQTQRQLTTSQNHFQILSLSDYLKKRAEGKL
jgi:hypothetical protein